VIARRMGALWPCQSRWTLTFLLIGGRDRLPERLVLDSNGIVTMTDAVSANHAEPILLNIGGIFLIGCSSISSGNAHRSRESRCRCSRVCWLDPRCWTCCRSSPSSGFRS
jgi:hypothetical protein